VAGGCELSRKWSWLPVYNGTRALSSEEYGNRHTRKGPCASHRVYDEWCIQGQTWRRTPKPPLGQAPRCRFSEFGR
jgi:hypothetical protein